MGRRERLFSTTYKVEGRRCNVALAKNGIALVEFSRGGEDGYSHASSQHLLPSKRSVLSLSQTFEDICRISERIRLDDLKILPGKKTGTTTVKSTSSEGCKKANLS